MTQNIKEETVRVLFHVRVEQKVEREEVAKVTGTNKDDSAVKAPVRRENAKIYLKENPEVAEEIEQKVRAHFGLEASEQSVEPETPILPPESDPEV